MVKKRVKLYGTLSKLFPDYQHSEGLEVEIGEGTKVKDLLVLLGIPESTGAVVAIEGMELEVPDDAEVKDVLSILGIQESQGAVVAMEGRILRTNDRIDGKNVHIFQAMQGG